MSDDRRLVQRIRAGDRAACEEFVDSYGARVHRLVRRYVDNPSDAEDVTQDIFVDLFRCLGTFRGDAALSTWIYRVAMNHCLKHCRDRRPEGIPLEETECQATSRHSDPLETAAMREMGDQVHEALQELSPLHRDVVVLHELHGLTYEECAAVLGTPVGTVKSRLSNAFRRLRVSLGSYVLGEPNIAPPGALPETSR